ncbi:pepsin A-like [Schistocerca gregaria]|uniref:pepsin A-like n=1 Tax=Schistocerca gregaria TaxID=7010 RepID=UPI00211E4EF4|nr:pepsin A-like [Schistocerca gregaria]
MNSIKGIIDKNEFLFVFCLCILVSSIACSQSDSKLKIPLKRIKLDQQQLQEKINCLKNGTLAQVAVGKHIELFPNLAQYSPKVDLQNRLNLEYYGVVSLGREKQDFFVTFDTGSSAFWVPLSVCKTGGCVGKNLYHPGNESVVTSKSVSITYGTGYMKGYVSADYMILDNIGFYTGFISAYEMDEFFAGVSLDGILGLAYPSIGKGNIKPVFDVLMDENVFSYNHIIFYLTHVPDGSFIQFGGDLDPQLYRGKLFSIPIIEKTYWTTALSSIAINEEIIVKYTPRNSRSIIDTGTSLIVGPRREIEIIESRIGTVKGDCSNLHELPNIGFQFGEGSPYFFLTPKQYVVKINDSCFSAFASVEQDTLWILGDAFIRGFYTVFDRDTDVVSLAPIIDNLNPDTESYIVVSGDQ